MDILELERAGWRALSDSGEAAAAFYNDVLFTEVLMLLPGGIVIDNRNDAINAMSGAPWDSHEIRDERVLALGPDAAVVTYRGHATRGGNEYEALFSSTYVRADGAWRLAVHQQTVI